MTEIMTEDINRRDFLKRATGTVGAVATGYGLSRSTRVLGANDRVVVGVIGTGRMGMDNLEDFAKQPEVDIAAVCDVYQPNLDQALKATNGAAKAYKDFREILDRKEIDVVIVAAPDHWHALPTVLACQAGKDVYVEKLSRPRSRKASRWWPRQENTTASCR